MTKPTDCYLTPGWVVDFASKVMGGIDLDPFHHPRSVVGAKLVIDERKGGDAYRDPWIGASALVNGPYSGAFPKLTAKRCMEVRRSTGMQIVNVCPAAPGAEYWAEYVWPWADAIAWLGRLGFVPGEDIYDKDGNLVQLAGSPARSGNVTEIAAVYQGGNARGFAAWFSRRAPVMWRGGVGGMVGVLGPWSHATRQAKAASAQGHVPDPSHPPLPVHAGLRPLRARRV